MFQRKRRSKVPGNAYRYRLEPLEPRVLLTTLFGGETFEFRAPNPDNPTENGPVIRVAIDGDAIVELVAADIDDQNEVVLGDLPGLITESDLGRAGAEILGGIGGADGVELIGPTPIDDPTSFLGSFFSGDNVAIEALATNEANQTFAFNSPTVANGLGGDETQKLIQVLSVSNSTGNATVVANLQQATLANDVMSTLNLPIGSVDAFTIDPETGLAYAINGSNLFQIERSTGMVTFIGPINSGGFEFQSLIGPDTVGSDIVGLASDAQGIFFSIFDDQLLNNALMRSLNADSPNPVGAVNGDLGANFNFIALTVGLAPSTDGFAVHDPGNDTLELYRLPVDDGSVTGVSGAALPPVLIGVITDSNGNGVTQIDAIDLDNNGKLIGIGTRAAVNPDGTQEVFRLDTETASANLVLAITLPTGVLTDPVTGVSFDETNALYAVARINDQDVLLRIRVDFNALPSESTQATSAGSVSANLVGLSSQIDPAGADVNHGMFFSLFDDDLINTFMSVSASSGDTNGDGNVDKVTEHNPSASTHGDLGPNVLNLLGFAVSPLDSDPAFGINKRGDELELVRFNRLPDGTSNPDTPFDVLGQITDALGNAVVELGPLDMDGSGALYSTGFNIDAPVPQVSIGGDLGGDFDFVDVTAISDGTTLFAVNFNAGGFFELYQLVRDPDTGVTAQPALLINRIRDANNNSILNIQAIEAKPGTGELIVVGTRGANSNMHAFEVNPITAIAESIGALVADFDGDEIFEPITDQVSGIAIQQQTLEIAIEVDPDDPGDPADTLDTGGGDGAVRVTVDAMGAFGAATNGGTSDAFYDPIGPIGSSQTTHASGVAIDGADSTVFLTEGNIGFSSGGTVVQDTVGNEIVLQSSFTFGNLRFDLLQSVFDAVDEQGAPTGSVLVQEYTITNTGASTQAFDLIRYLDADLFFQGGFRDDGGGRLVFPDGTEVLFETEEGGTVEDDVTFIGITAEGGGIPTVNRFAVDQYFNLGTDILNEVPLDDMIAGDGDGDQFIDPGAEYDVTIAFRNEFLIAPGESDQYTTQTLWGTGEPEETITPVPLNADTETIGVFDLAAVVQDTSGAPTVDRLIEFRLSDVVPGSDIEVDDFGLIEVSSPAPNTPTLLGGIDYTTDGDLLGLNFAAGAGLGEIVAVNPDDPTTSTVRTDPALTVPVNDNLVGFTVTNEDRGLSVFDDGPANDELWINPNVLVSIGQVAMDLDGDITDDEVLATQVSILNVPGGRVATNAFSGLAHNPDTGLFVAIERLDLLGTNEFDHVVTIDPALPVDAMVDVGQSRIGGQSTRLNEIDFNDTLTLIGVNDATSLTSLNSRHLAVVDLLNPEASTQLSTAGSFSDSHSGFSFNAAGVAFTLFDREVMNDALVSGIGDQVPLPMAPFDGATNDLDVAATTVANDPGEPDDGRIFVVHDTGGGAAFELYELLFNVNGTVDQYMQVGGTAIETATGNDITDIEAVEYDPVNNRLVMVGLDTVTSATDRMLFTFAIGSNVAASEMALTIGGSLTDTISALAYDLSAPTPILYGVRDPLATDETLVTIDSDTGIVTQIGLLPIGVGNQPTEIGYFDFDATNLLIAGDFSLGTAQGRQVVVNTTQPNNSREHSEPGSLSNRLRGVGVDSAGRYISIDDGGDAGVGVPDMLAISANLPKAFVQGDLQENLQPLAMAVTPQGDTFMIVENQSVVTTAGGPSKFGELELQRIDRDPVTGVPTGVTRLGNLTDASGVAITSINALDANPIADPVTGEHELFGVGISSPVPSASVGGSLGETFLDVVAINVEDTGDNATAIANSTTDTGELVDIVISITLDPVTGQVTGAGAEQPGSEIRQQLATGQDAGTGNRILGIQAFETDINVFGFDADAPIPNVTVGQVGGPGAQIGDQIIEAFVINANDQMFTMVQQDPDPAITPTVKDLYEVMRELDTNAVSQFRLIGTIRDTNGNTINVNPRLIIDDPLNPNRFYALATTLNPNTASLSQELFVIDGDTAVASSIARLFDGQFVETVYSALHITPDGSTLFAASGSALFLIDPETAIVTDSGVGTPAVTAWDYNPEGELLGIEASRILQFALDPATDLPSGDTNARTNVGAAGWPLIPSNDPLGGASAGTLLATYQFTSDGAVWGLADQPQFIGDELWTNTTNEYSLSGSTAAYVSSLTITRSIGGMDQVVAVTDPITATATAQGVVGPFFHVLEEAGADRLVTNLATLGAPGTEVVTTMLGYEGGTFVGAGDGIAATARIQVNGVDTDLNEFAFNQAGQLVGLNRIAGQANHLVLLDPATPTATRQISDFGSADQGLGGLSSDINSRYFSVNRTQRELWINTQQLFQISTTPLDNDGDLVEDEIVGTIMGALEDGQSRLIENINALAWRPDGSEILAVRNLPAETLIAIDPVTAALTTISEIHVDGLSTDIVAADFNIDGRLIGLDDSLGTDRRRLIVIALPEEAENLGVIQVDGQDVQTVGIDFSADDGTGSQQLIAMDDSPGPGSLRVEPNDTIVDATSSALPDSGTFIASGAIGDNPGVPATLDVDLISVELTANDQIQIDVDAVQIGSTLNPRLRLFNSAGLEMATSDNDPAPGELFTNDPFIDFIALTTETFFVGVSSSTNTTYDPAVAGSGLGGTTGTYNIDIQINPDVLGNDPLSLRRLIQIDTVTPDESEQLPQAPTGSVSNKMEGFSSNNANDFHAILNDDVLNSALYVSNTDEFGDFSPIRSASSDLGGDFGFTDVTVIGIDNRVFAVENPSTDVFDLYRIDKNTTLATTSLRLGRITDAQGGVITQLNAIDTMPSSTTLQFVGLLNGVQQLFTIDPDQPAIDTDNDGNADELVAVSIGTLKGPDGAIFQPVTALAYRGTSLFGVIRQNDQDQFVQIDPLTTTVTELDVIGVDGLGTFIIAMDEDDDGNIVALDAANRQLILITQRAGSNVNSAQAAAFSPDGDFYVIAAFDDDLNDLEPANQKLIAVNKHNGSFSTFDDLQTILIDGVPVLDTFSAMVFFSGNSVFATTRAVDDTGNASTNMHELLFTGAGDTIIANLLGQVTLGDSATTIDGLTTAFDLDNTEILVAADTGTNQLLSIQVGGVAAEAISEPGTILGIGGLSALAEPGNVRPLLYATNGSQLLRGSAVSLPVDSGSGASTVSAVTAADFEPGSSSTAAFGLEIIDGFDTLDFSGSVPPDTIGAAGPDHLVEVVNTAIGFFDKATGQPLFEQQLNSFFSSVNAGSNVFDPLVYYDELAGRFFVAAVDVDFASEEAFLVYAVSNSENPLDGFDEMHRVQVNKPALNFFDEVWGDFPRAGYNADAHLISLNMFTFGNTLPEAFDHVNLIAFDKSTVLDANPNTINFVESQRSNTDSTMVPAVMHGSAPGDPMFFVQSVEEDFGNEIRVTRMDNVLAPNPLFSDTNLTISPYSSPTPAEQPGPGQLDSGDTRMLAAAWRDNRLVATHTIGTSTGESQVRWYEFDTVATPHITQSGEVHPGQDVWTYYPSIDINNSGDLGLTFMQSSPSQFVSMYVTGQEFGDADGTTRVPIATRLGEATYDAFDGSPFRAGDYSGINVDPVDGETFWVFNEFATSAFTNNWGTAAANFQLIEPTEVVTENTGRLFFIASSGATDATDDTGDTDDTDDTGDTGDTDDTGDTVTNRMYTLDVSASNPSALQNTLGQVPGSFSGDQTLTSIAFDQTDTDLELIGYSTAGSLVDIDPDNLGFSFSFPNVTLFGEEVTDISAIEFVHPSSTEQEPFVYAVKNAGEDSQLLRIRRNTGQAFVLGPLSDPDDQPLPDTEDPAPTRGENLVGMAWHEDIFNPFTNDLGALIATDTGSDELVIVDHRPRFPTANIFNIYVSQSSPDANIIIAALAEPDPEALALSGDMLPFEGSIGSVRILPAVFTEEPYELVAADDGTGQVYIGARTENLDQVDTGDDDDIDDGDDTGDGDDTDDDGDDTAGDDQVELDSDDDDDGTDQFPITTASLTESIGVRAGGVDDLDDFDDLDDPLDNLSAGIIVATNLLEYVSDQPDLADRMLGFNLDEISGLAVSRDGGRIVVVDSDAVDEDGSVIEDSGGEITITPQTLQAFNGVQLGDQLSLVDPETGRADSPVTITDMATGNLLHAVQGLDYADPDFDGVEQLYAVYAVGSTPTLGELDPDTGEFSSIEAIMFGTSPRIVSMAFSPSAGSFGGQGLYFIADPDTEDFEPALNLYELEYTVDVDGVIDSVGNATLIGQIADDEGDARLVGGFDFDRIGRAFVHDREFGSFSDLNIATGVVGQLSATDAGTLRPSVAEISFNFATNQFMAVDNATGAAVLENEGRLSFFASFFFNPFGDQTPLMNPESATLMTIAGTAADQEIAQSVDRIFIGGAVTGIVHVPGSMNTFYAGWLLTGDTQGQLSGPPTMPDNFFVGNELRNLISRDSIGTESADQTYLTGFDLTVDGRAHQVSTLDTFTGGLLINNLDLPNTLGQTQREIEHKPNVLLLETDGSVFEGTGFGEDIESLLDPAAPDFGFINVGPALNIENDTFEEAQPLGVIATGPNNQQRAIRVTGLLDGFGETDMVDYYSVALMAGQELTVQLLTLGFLDLNVGVFDPDGRLIATDYSNVASLDFQGAPFRFTADRPGEYRIAVAFPGDSNFSGTTDEDETSLSILLGDAPYLLSVDGAGDLAIGALTATNNIVGMAGLGALPVVINRGDLGALRAGQDILDLSFENWVVFDGNLRSVTAAQIGEVAGLLQLDVPRGSVGLLQATGDLIFNNGLVPPVIGGDFQIIDAGVGLVADVMADRGIGVVRATDIGFVAAPTETVDGTDQIAGNGILDQDGDSNIFVRYFTSFSVNVDGIAQDGIIDLIDVTGDLGTAGSGGPAIDTGPGGNVRFIRVGGEVFQDRFFGGGFPTETQLTPGESFTVRDDSGGEITISPSGTAGGGGTTGGDTGGDGDDTGGGVGDDAGGGAPSLLIKLYGIRSSGGSVITSASADGSVTIKSEGFGNDAPVEITELFVDGTGAAIILDRGGNLALEEAENSNDTPSLRVSVTGNTPVDLFSVSGGTAGSATGAVFNSFRNTTGGELVNFLSTSVGTLFNEGPIGLPKNHTGAAIIPNVNATLSAQFAGLDFPFNDQRTGIDVGTALRVESDMGIGNVIAQGGFGTINKLTANIDKKDDPTAFEGIAGPILASGNLNFVQIGEGLAESGTGDLAFAGLFAGGGGGTSDAGDDGTTGEDGTTDDDDETTGNRGNDDPTAGFIGRIVNQGIGSDIRGDIAVTVGIGKIDLKDGAIINADIYQSSDIADTREFVRPFAVTETEAQDFFDDPEFEIQSIELDGIGGIIGSSFFAADMGTVEVDDGFGILNSVFAVGGDGIYDDITADGFGIRDVLFRGGASMYDITASGKGSVVSTNSYTLSVRTNEFDPPLATSLNDLATFLGKTSDISGVIENVIARGSRSLGTVEAFQIRATDPDLPTMFNFANSIKAIKTLDLVNHLSVTTGRLDLFKPASDVSDLDLTVAGRVKKIQIAGSLLDSSTVTVAGPNGNLKKFSVEGDLDGVVMVDGIVGTFEVDGDMNGSLIIRGTNLDSVVLKKFILGGTLTNGSLNVDGHVNTIDVAGSLGAGSDQLTINGNLKKMLVGTGKTIIGSDMAMDLLVRGDLNRFNATGTVSGSITVEGNAKRFEVRADAATAGTDILTADVTVLGTTKRATINGGNIGPGVQFVSGTGIGRFTVDGGDVAVGAAIVSSFGDIARLIVEAGDLFGAVRAPNGTIKRLEVSGSDLGGAAGVVRIDEENVEDGDTITIGDGANQVTFEFDDNGGVGPGHTPATIGVDAETTADNLEQLIDDSALSIDAAEYAGDPLQLDLVNTIATRGSTVPISVAGHLTAISASPALLEALHGGRIALDGSIKAGSEVNFFRSLSRFEVGMDIEAGVTLTAGAAARINVGRDLLGDMEIGDDQGGTRVTVGGSFGGTIQSDGNTRLNVADDVADGATVSIGKNLEQFDVGATLFGDVFVDGSGGKWSFGATDGAVITTAFGLDQLAVALDINQTLIQTGLGRGADGVFAATAGSRDVGEQVGASTLGKLSAETIRDSVIASSGDFDQLDVDLDMTNSSASSGFSVGSTAIAVVLADPTPLATGTEQAAARSADDRALRQGDFNSASTGTAGLNDSMLTAGVDPGTGRVLLVASLPQGGGNSAFGSVNVPGNSGSTILSDAGISKNNISGGATTNFNVSYDLDELTTDMGSPLETTIGIVGADSSAFFESLLISLQSDTGTVHVHDNTPDDGRIDTLVVQGTNADTVLTVTGDGEIGRVLSEDDAVLKEFAFSGTIDGDQVDDAPDIWLDATASNYSFGALADGVTAVIGGDVDTLSIGDLGAALVSVLGTIDELDIIEGSGGNGLLTDLAPAPTADVSAMATDSAGNTWVFDSAAGTLTQVDTTSGAIAAGPTPVTDASTGESVVLEAIDYLEGAVPGDDLMLAVADLFDPSPIVEVGSLVDPAASPPSLRGMAVGPNGEIVAIENVGVDTDDDGVVDFYRDHLVRFDPATGSIIVIGEVRDLFNNDFGGALSGQHQVLQLAFAPDGRLLALVADRDGTGPATSTADGAALVKIEPEDTNDDGAVTASSPANDFLPGVLLDDAGESVLDDLTAMAVASDGTIFAIRRVGVEDRLVTIAENATVVNLGTIKVNGADTNALGMGFDANDSLLAYDNDTLAAQLIVVDTVDPTSSVELGEPGLLSPLVDAFAIGGLEDRLSSFAYDDDGVAGGRLLMGMAQTRVLGSVDPATGLFTRRAALRKADGAAVAESVNGIAVDNDDTGNVVVATEDGRLFEYASADAALINVADAVTDPATGRTVTLTAIEFVDGVVTGIDADLNRLVQIDRVTGQIAPLLEPGAVDESVTAITFDPTTETLRGFNTADDVFVRFNGTTQDALAGVVAESINSATVTGLGTFYSRIATLGNSIASVSLTTDFAGSIVTAGTIGEFDLLGAFTGTVLAGMDIEKMSIAGPFETAGVVIAGNLLDKFDLGAGDLAGLIQSTFAGTWRFDAALATADLLVSGAMDTISFNGDFDGSMHLGAVDRELEVNGTLGSTAHVLIDQDAARITLSGGTDAGSRVTIAGSSDRVTAGGTHSGAIAVQHGVDRMTLDDADGGLIAVGQQSGRLQVKGDSDGAVFSFGAAIGSDEVYNSDDDILTGGSLDRANFDGDFVDSVLAIAVLPTANAPSNNINNLPDDNRAFTTMSLATDVQLVSGSEGGALFSGELGRLTYRDEIRSTSTPTGRQAMVVTAAGIDRQSLGPFGFALTQAQFDDPAGAPTVVGAEIVGDSEIQITFSEPINTRSFILAEDNNKDGDTDDSFDTPGSILVVDGEGNVLGVEDITLLYLTRLNAQGDTQGVLRVTKPEGFGQSIEISLFGRTVNDDSGEVISQQTLAQTPAIFDGSGLRSVLRDFNQNGITEVGEDPLKTIFDGNGDAVEGGDLVLPFILEDVADSFTDAMLSDPLAMTVDSGPLTLTTKIDDAGDIDVFRFTTDAFNFLAVDYEGDLTAQLAVFALDDQGTPEIEDDTYEMITRWEINEDLALTRNMDFGGVIDPDLFMAFELPPMEAGAATNGFRSTDLDYFVVVASNEFASNSYSLELTLTSTDTALGTLPDGEVIAYISNSINENNNAEGANDPAQLVYLDFDGGESLDVRPGQLVAAFDASTISPLLEGMEDLLINGGPASTGPDIVGIVDRIVEAFATSPTSPPNGQLNVQVLDGDLAPFLAPDAEGLFLTTEDPALAGLDPEADFTTVLLGQLNARFGLFGEASVIDMANQSKADEAIVFIQNFSLLNFGISNPSDPDTLAREFAESIGGITSHEIGHLLGLNHTLRSTITDDPNNDGDASDTVESGQHNLIASGPDSIFPEDFLTLPVLGTSPLSTGEFPAIGGTFRTTQASVDSLSSLLFWLG